MLTGAISGLTFSSAGSIIHGAEITSAVAQAGIHMGAGAVSGGINAGITGNDIGMSMVSSGISAGMSKYAGLKLFDEGGILHDTMSNMSWGGRFLTQFASYSVIGGISGGITNEIYGGDFGRGFIYGTRTAAYGYLFNWCGEAMAKGAWIAVRMACHDIRYNDQLHKGTLWGFNQAAKIAVGAHTVTGVKALLFTNLAHTTTFSIRGLGTAARTNIADPLFDAYGPFPASTGLGGAVYLYNRYAVPWMSRGWEGPQY